MGGGSLVAQLVKNPPAMRETWIRSLGWEDLLGRERLPTPVLWPGEFLGLYSPWGCKESDTIERLLLFSLFSGGGGGGHGGGHGGGGPPSPVSKAPNVRAPGAQKNKKV